MNSVDRRYPDMVRHLAARQQGLIDLDRGATCRKSQDNADIMRLHRVFYGEPNSHLAHELLHTTYRPR